MIILTTTEKAIEVRTVKMEKIQNKINTIQNNITKLKAIQTPLFIQRNRLDKQIAKFRRKGLTNDSLF